MQREEYLIYSVVTSFWNKVRALTQQSKPEKKYILLHLVFCCCYYVCAVFFLSSVSSPVHLFT